MPINRRRAVFRAKYGWPRKSVKFDRQAIHQPDGYRQDAAGYISMCWDIPLDAPRSWGGLTNVTLLTDGWVTEIDASELKPGDGVGYLGPESVDADGGVIVLFEKWLDIENKIAATWEHLPIIGLGPDLRGRPIDFKWHAYRFRDIVDDPV